MGDGLSCSTLKVRRPIEIQKLIVDFEHACCLDVGRQQDWAVMTLKVLSISFNFALLVFTRCGGVTGQSGVCERTNPMLHFLFLVYDRVHNGDLWNHFFAGAPANAYSINIQYSKKTFLKESWSASLSEKSEIGHYSKKTFRYARYVHASDNLLM